MKRSIAAAFTAILVGAALLAPPAQATEVIDGQAYINAAAPPASLKVSVGARVCVASSSTEVGPYVGVSLEPLSNGAITWGKPGDNAVSPPTGYARTVCFEAKKPGRSYLRLLTNRLPTNPSDPMPAADSHLIEITVQADSQ